MKRTILLGTLCTVILLSACNGSTTQTTGDTSTQQATETPIATTDKNTNKVSWKEQTAESICNLLKEQIPSIGAVAVYNEENDINKLLGRPNQYTSKVNFADTRIEQTSDNIDDVIGGSIEVFENEKNAQARKDYIASIMEQLPTMTEYDYLYGNVLLRLDKSLTPSQAKEYADILETYYTAE